MATEHTNGDMLGLFLTWFSAITVDIGLVGELAPPFVLPDEPASVDPDNSLGGFRSSVYAEQIGFFINDSIAGIIIERVSGENGEGYGSLEAVDGDSLRWTAPGGQPGSVVAIANGETKMLESGNSEQSKFIVVSRHTADDLTGNATVVLVSIFNNVIGSSNVEWLSPTGYNDPDNKWTDEANAYNDISTYAYITEQGDYYLELTLDEATSCDRVKFYVDSEQSGSRQGIVDIYYGGGWNNIYTGVFPRESWIEVSFGSQSITKARIKLSTASAGWRRVHAFKFHKTQEVKLRCVSFKNKHTTDAVKNLKVWLNTFGTQQVSDTGQLPASGAGTIETSGSFNDWPDTGFCRIDTSGDSLREIVYYSARTDTVLTVPAEGRELLGTTAAAGAATDKIYAVPGIKIAIDTPPFVIADDENDIDAVSGLTWNIGITESTGLDIGNLTAGQQVAVWIWLETVLHQTATASLENAIQLSFSTGEGAGEIFLDNQAAGRYRVADDDVELYELYRGVGSEPDLSGSPWEIFGSLPHETAALAFSQTYYFVLRKRNKYNLVTQNIASWSVELDGSGSVIETNPEAPDNISIIPAAGGTGFVEAQYIYDKDDAYAATHWLIYFTDDGTDPNPAVDTPTVVAMKKSGGIARLQWTSPAADDGDTLKVLVRTRRISGSNYDSQNTDIYSATAETEGPELPKAKAFYGRSAESM